MRAIKFFLLALTIFSFSDCFAETDKYVKDMENACRKGNGQKCQQLAASIYKVGVDAGYGRDMAFEKSEEFFKRACNLKKSLSCWLLAAGYDERGIYQSAKIYYEKGCAIGDKNGGRNCTGLAVLYTSGKGVDRSYSTAKRYFEKACRLKDGSGCTGLGTLYGDGLGVRQSYSTAKQYFGKGCDLGDDLGCSFYSKFNKLGY